MKRGLQLLGVGISLSLAACSNDTPAFPPIEIQSGIAPDIVIGDISPRDKVALSQWIQETVELLKSTAFETNFMRASEIYPDVYVSKTQDIIPSALLLRRLKTQDPHLSAFWWPKTYVVLNGTPARRLEDRTGFGFDALRNAGAGPFPENEIGTKTGEIEVGRLHFARFTQGDIVEKSCAINTMAHEIAHTLSDKADKFWMHILDSEKGVTPPRGVFEASYFIGSIAQCTYLENVGRIEHAGFESCMLTFSDPAAASRFRSLACDDFPYETPITPSGRLQP